MRARVSESLGCQIGCHPTGIYWPSILMACGWKCFTPSQYTQRGFFLELLLSASHLRNPYRAFGRTWQSREVKRSRWAFMGFQGWFVLRRRRRVVDVSGLGEEEGEGGLDK